MNRLGMWICQYPGISYQIADRLSSVHQHNLTRRTVQVDFTINLTREAEMRMDMC